MFRKSGTKERVIEGVAGTASAREIKGVKPPSHTPLFNGGPIPSYPDTGMAVPSAPPSMLLESQEQLIEDIHLTSTFSRAEFDTYLLPVIRNYAAFVHLLPGSESHHHCGQGGLFRHGLEVAYYAARKCEATVFGLDHPPSVRKFIEPRYRMCAIIGGLLHDIGKPVVDVGAVSEDGQKSWNPHVGMLYDWLTREKLSYYYIFWRGGTRHKRHEAYSTAALYRIIPSETIEWIARHSGQEAFDNMLMSMAGVINPQNPLVDIIHGADSSSVSRDVAASRSRMAASGMGSAFSLSSRLTRAMYDMVLAGSWVLNRPGDGIWVTDQGVFGAYPVVCRAAIEKLRDGGDKSLPTEVGAILDTLLDYGYITPNIGLDGTTRATWDVLMHTKDRGKDLAVTMKCIRFARDEVVPRDIVQPDPVHVDLIDSNGEVIDMPGLPVEEGDVSTPEAKDLAPVQDPPVPASDASQEVKHAEQDNAAPLPAHERPPEAKEPQAADTGVEKPSAAGSVQSPGKPKKVVPSNVPGEGPLEELPRPAKKEGREQEDAGEQTVLRDRGRERGVRSQMMSNAWHEMTKRWPPANYAEAETWLHSKLPEGAYLLTIARRINSGQLSREKDMAKAGEHMCLRYPEAMEGLGIPAGDVRKGLEEKGWMERSAATPGRATVEVPCQGGKMVALQMSVKISEVLDVLLNQPGEARRPPAAASASHGPGGKHLDEARIALLQSTSVPTPEDAPVVRNAFHTYLLDEVGEDDDSRDWRQCVLQFCKGHRLGRPWVEHHLLQGPNALMLKVDGKVAKGKLYRPNPDYAPETDAEVVAKRMDRL